MLRSYHTNCLCVFCSVSLAIAHHRAVAILVCNCRRVAKRFAISIRLRHCLGIHVLHSAVGLSVAIALHVKSGVAIADCLVVVVSYPCTAAAWDKF